MPGGLIDAYATESLDGPLPWTKMLEVYALLGLVKKWGPERVHTGCARAAEVEAFNVGLIGRLLERNTEARLDEVPIRASYWPSPRDGARTVNAAREMLGGPR